jgi:hypothetical protein
MIPERFCNGDTYAEVVECVCTLDGYKYRIQVKYKRKEIDGRSICYMIYGSMKILEVIK